MMIWNIAPIQFVCLLGYIDVFEIRLLDQLGIRDAFDFHMPDTKVEVGAPCHQWDYFDVLARKDN